MDPLICVFPGPNRFEELVSCLQSTFEIRGDDPVNVRIGEQLCLVWRIEDPLVEGLFDEAWSGVEFDLDDTVLAIDFKSHASVLTVVQLLHFTFGAFTIDTNFGEICSVSEFLLKYSDGRRVWTDPPAPPRKHFWRRTWGRK
jgi:hypothetical protein